MLLVFIGNELYAQLLCDTLFLKSGDTILISPNYYQEKSKFNYYLCGFEIPNEELVVAKVEVSRIGNFQSNSDRINYYSNVHFLCDTLISKKRDTLLILPNHITYDYRIKISDCDQELSKRMHLMKLKEVSTVKKNRYLYGVNYRETEQYKTRISINKNYEIKGTLLNISSKSISMLTNNKVPINVYGENLQQVEIRNTKQTKRITLIAGLIGFGVGLAVGHASLSDSDFYNERAAGKIMKSMVLGTGIGSLLGLSIGSSVKIKINVNKDANRFQQGFEQNKRKFKFLR